MGIELGLETKVCAFADSSKSRMMIRRDHEQPLNYVNQRKDTTLTSSTTYSTFGDSGSAISLIFILDHDFVQMREIFGVRKSLVSLNLAVRPRKALVLVPHFMTTYTAYHFYHGLSSCCTPPLLSLSYQYPIQTINITIFIYLCLTASVFPPIISFCLSLEAGVVKQRKRMRIPPCMIHQSDQIYSSMYSIGS